MKTLVEYAKTHVGLPYRWGGDDPIEGYDCSGLVQEILASVAEDPPGDQTADALYRHFYDKKIIECRPGALVFYGSRDRVTHVGFCIDEFRMVEAGGGNSRTRDILSAARHNAYVRIRPVSRRRDFVAFVMPKYDKLRMDL